MVGVGDIGQINAGHVIRPVTFKIPHIDAPIGIGSVNVGRKIGGQGIDPEAVD